MRLDAATRSTLARIAREHATPCYVYFVAPMLARAAQLRQAFGDRLALSYAVKSNPNRALLRQLRGAVAGLDVSSGGEIERALEAGYAASALSFTGHAKRPVELERAVEIGCGEVVCESEWEIEALNRIAARGARRMRVLIRVNPLSVPRNFGVQMAGRPSQFGIDEEDVDAVLARREHFEALDLAGFHVYSGTNSLSEPALAEHFDILCALFAGLSARHGVAPRKLVFGAGFGIPYHEGDRPLDLDALAPVLAAKLDALREQPGLGDAACVLELGRFLVGESGYFLTSVVGEKRSRGTEIRICDGGFNNHLAAAGLLGMVMRRNYPMWRVSGDDDAASHEYLLAGPLCTAIDVLAQKIALPELRRGDVIAIGSSGAYGLSSSPTGFISHPAPRELLVLGEGAQAQCVDVTEEPLGA